MADGRFKVTLSALAVVLVALALARLGDAVGKRELMRAVREVRLERARVGAEFEEMVDRKVRLELDQQLLSHRITHMSKREHYLVVSRDRGTVQLFFGDKELLEVKFRLRGSTDGVSQFVTLPKGTFQILGKRMDTDWYRPDWLYRLEGLTPPRDSAERLVRNAFGPAELFLGGALSIHGPVSDAVPEGAVDHTYIELDEKSLKAVANAVGPGSLVYIE
ncbi:MAG: L,D-transpeptidase [candidate division WOR-3 bacterium]